jgi:hypothetical protein
MASAATTRVGTRACEICGLVLTKRAGESRAIFADRRFCSQTCHGRSRMLPREMRACETCGASFAVAPQSAAALKGFQRNCSRPCAQRCVSATRRCLRPPIKQCETCGGAIPQGASISYERYSRRRYCSLRCRRPQARTWRPLAEVQQWARERGLRTRLEWQSLARASEWPRDIPKAPQAAYPDWPGWVIFLDHPWAFRGAPRCMRGHLRTKENAAIGPGRDGMVIRVRCRVCARERSYARGGRPESRTAWTAELFRVMLQHGGDYCSVPGCDRLKSTVAGKYARFNVCSRHRAYLAAVFSRNRKAYREAS